MHPLSVLFVFALAKMHPQTHPQMHPQVQKNGVLLVKNGQMTPSSIKHR